MISLSVLFYLCNRNLEHRFWDAEKLPYFNNCDDLLSDCPNDSIKTLLLNQEAACVRTSIRDHCQTSITKPEPYSPRMTG